MASFVEMPADDGPSPRDALATCDACARRGTSVRVTRHTSPPRQERYCSECWRSLRHTVLAVPDVLAASASMEAIEAFTRHTPEPAITVVSRCWDDTLDFLSWIQDPPVGASRRDAATLAAYYRELAGEIRDIAEDMDGPMPSAVYTFIRQHGDPAP